MIIFLWLTTHPNLLIPDLVFCITSVKYTENLISDQPLYENNSKSPIHHIKGGLDVRLLSITKSSSLFNTRRGRDPRLLLKRSSRMLQNGVSQKRLRVLAATWPLLWDQTPAGRELGLLCQDVISWRSWCHAWKIQQWTEKQCKYVLETHCHCIPLVSS